MLESKLAVAKVFPDGAHATDQTVFVCTIHRDDPTAIEQVRVILFVKQKQNAVVECRREGVLSLGVSDGLRGSTPGLLEGC